MASTVQRGQYALAFLLPDHKTRGGFRHLLGGGVVPSPYLRRLAELRFQILSSAAVREETACDGAASTAILEVVEKRVAALGVASHGETAAFLYQHEVHSESASPRSRFPDSHFTRLTEGFSWCITPGANPSEGMKALAASPVITECWFACRFAFLQAILGEIGDRQFDALFEATGITPLLTSKTKDDCPWVEQFVRSDEERFEVGYWYYFNGCGTQYAPKAPGFVSNGLNVICVRGGDSESARFAGLGDGAVQRSSSEILNSLFSNYRDVSGKGQLSRLGGELRAALEGKSSLDDVDKRVLERFPIAVGDHPVFHVSKTAMRLNAELIAAVKKSDDPDGCRALIEAEMEKRRVADAAAAALSAGEG